MAANGDMGHSRKTAPFPGVRWALAALIVAGWLGLFGYWLVSGDQPVCHVTTVSLAGSPTRTTRSCGLPDATSYLYVFGVVAMLLLPDARSIRVGAFQFDRLEAAAAAAQVGRRAVEGDKPEGAQTASQVFNELLGPGGKR